MPPPVPITDPHDARLGDYAALTDAALRKRYEREEGVLIAEGPNPVRALLDSPYPIRSLLLARERLETHGDLVERVRALAAPVYVVSRDLLYEIVRFRLHQGIIACGARRPAARVEDVLAGANRIAVFEGLNDHENLGTLFRSARGLGMDGVLLGPGCADPLYRRSVRVSMGHVLHVPQAWVRDLAVGLAELRSAGFTTVALTPGPDAVDLRALSLDASMRVAVLLGAEGPGLSPAALAAADMRVRIPMHHGVDSVNVAAAGAIAFHALALNRPPPPETTAIRAPR